ncbi:MAG: hypothetical protein VYD90_11260 [Pseudomonadota bacterium]|nr:hypothetical protein [Pseudomonadota bacterium]
MSRDFSHICTFYNGYYRAHSPSGKHSVLFEDSDRFGPSRVSSRTGDLLDGNLCVISPRLRWFWDWYSEWRKQGRPHHSTLQSPFGPIHNVYIGGRP